MRISDSESEFCHVLCYLIHVLVGCHAFEPFFIEAAGARLKPYEDSVVLIRDNYRNVRQALREA